MHSCIHLLKAHSSKVALGLRATYRRGKVHFFPAQDLLQDPAGIQHDTVRESTGLVENSFRGGNTGVGYIKHCKEVGSTFPLNYLSERNKKYSSLIEIDSCVRELYPQKFQFHFFLDLNFVS